MISVIYSCGSKDEINELDNVARKFDGIQYVIRCPNLHWQHSGPFEVNYITLVVQRLVKEFFIIIWIMSHYRCKYASPKKSMPFIGLHAKPRAERRLAGIIDTHEMQAAREWKRGDRVTVAVARGECYRQGKLRFPFTMDRMGHTISSLSVFCGKPP